ncbi:hypothetical protein EV361DRAFT_41936 [Lentinula raphanica]|nr:hypothetical protein EV361DRAFT_41936 [Lentinula raphanica]
MFYFIHICLYSYLLYCSFASPLRYSFVPRFFHSDSAPTLALFSSLRVLYLGHVFRRINFESRNTPSVLRVDSRDIRTVPKAQAEHKLSLLTSCLAKQVRTLDSFHIEEQGYEDGKLGYRRYGHWSLRGWLHVLNSNREVGGTLQ